MKKNGLSIVCLALMPFTRLIQLYNANTSEFTLAHTLIAGAVISAFLLAEYGILRTLLKSHFSALFLSLGTCLILFTEPFLYDLSIKIQRFLHGTRTWVGLAPLMVVTLGLAFVLARLGRRAPQEFNLLLAVITGFMLLINVIPLISFELNKSRVSVAYRSKFSLDVGTKRPNIYWFHLDGMLGQDTVEKYFGISASAYDKELTRRNFYTFENVSLEANHRTVVAIPALTCPDYYDRVLREIIDNDPTHWAAFEYCIAHPMDIIDNGLKNEMLTAFLQKGYDVNLLSTYYSRYYLGPSTKFYAIAEHNTFSDLLPLKYPFLVTESRFENHYQWQSVNSLLKTLLDWKRADWLCNLIVPPYDKREPLTHMPSDGIIRETLLGNEKGIHFYSSLVKSLYDELETANNPRFTLIHDLSPHAPFIFSPDGKMDHPEDIFDMRNYPSHYDYSFQITMNMVDMVIEQDPDAIIALVGDHGIHIGMNLSLLEGSYGPEDELALYNNIFYAIRIPETWDANPDLVLLAEPRNLSRYLINSFVGLNYGYLKP